jgi:signal transduction histidine kinase
LLFFAPIVAAFQTARINDRLNLAETAAIALGSSEVQDDLQRNLIEEAEILRIALGSEEGRELLLESPIPRDATGVPRTYDYREATLWQRIAWAIETLTSPPGRVLLVLGKPRYQAGDFVEILINERPLKQELWAYAWQALVASLLISALAAAAIYYLLTWLFVRPVERLTHRVVQFSKAPEDASIFASASARADEIGRAERALADMAEHVRSSLRQRERLAALGAAVARIAHDLRNVLSTAQLVTERLGKSEDPGVKQAAPRLERAIGRAAGLAAAALRYGKAEEAAPVLSPLRVHAAVSEALDDALAAFPTLSRRAAVSEDLIAIADPDSVHRILVNLIRNAAQAAAGVRPDAEDAVLVSAERRGAVIVIAVKDRGGGVPDSARAILFQPFVSADRAGGAGLGLAISRELARAQGGDVRLAETNAEGAVFEATLPAA